MQTCRSWSLQDFPAHQRFQQFCLKFQYLSWKHAGVEVYRTFLLICGFKTRFGISNLELTTSRSWSLQESPVHLSLKLFFDIAVENVQELKSNYMFFLSILGFQNMFQILVLELPGVEVYEIVLSILGLNSWGFEKQFLEQTWEATIFKYMHLCIINQKNKLYIDRYIYMFWIEMTRIILKLVLNQNQEK